MTAEGRLIAITAGVMIFIFSLGSISAAVDSTLAWNRLYLIPLALVFGGLLVYLSAPAPTVGKIELWEIISSSLLLAALLIMPPRDSDRLFFYIALLIAGVLLTLYGISRLGWDLFTSAPLTATYVNRNHFCAFLGLILPLAVSFGLGADKRPLAWLSRGAVPVLIGGILLTKSRGGFLAALSSALAVLVFFRFPQKNNKKLLLIFCCLLAVIAVAVLYSRYQPPVVYSTSLDALSIQTRFAIWESTLKMFLARPLTGWGWGTFKYVYPLFKSPGVWYAVPHAHNEFIQLLGEGGLAGFFVVLGCLVGVLRRLIKNYGSAPKTLGGLFALGAAGSLVYMTVHGVFDFILRLPANVFLITVIAGLGLSVCPPGTAARAGITRRPFKLVFSFLIVGTISVFILLPLVRFYRATRAGREGERLLSAGKMEEAEASFTEAIELDPDAVRPLCGRATARMGLFDRLPDKAGLYGAIMADLNLGRRNNPRDLRPLWDLIRFHQRLSSYAVAEGYLRQALSLDPVSPHLYYELARNDLFQGNLIAAAHNLRKATAIYECMWDASFKLLFSSTDDYEILKELPPPESGYHRSLGYHLMSCKKWVAAEIEFKKAIALSPTEPVNWRALGRLYARTGDPEESLKCYQKALSLSPNNAEWLAEMGDVLKSLGMMEEALKHYLGAQAIAPGNKSYPEKAAAIIYQLKGKNAAITFWEGVTEKNHAWDRPYYLRAKLYLEIGDISRAKKEIELALQRAPRNQYYLNLKKKLDLNFPPENLK